MQVQYLPGVTFRVGGLVHLVSRHINFLATEYLNVIITQPLPFRNQNKYFCNLQAAEAWNFWQKEKSNRPRIQWILTNSE